MKKILTTVLAIGMITMAFSQPPQKFKYQAVVRGPAGAVLASTIVAFRFQILASSPVGPPRYSERHVVTTNAYGMAFLSVGSGIPLVGTWDNIQWHNNDFYLRVGLDITGGTAYIPMGTSQLQSVPYAMYDGDWIINNDDIYYSEGNVGIGINTPSCSFNVAKDENSDQTSLYSDHLYIHIADTSQVVGEGPGIGFSNSTILDNVGAKIAHIRTGAASIGDLAFYTKNSSLKGDQTSERMRITSEGKLGIGTETPSCWFNMVKDENSALTSSDAEHLYIHLTDTLQVNGEGPGIGFSNSSNSDNVGAKIVHIRTGDYSIGDLAFFTKDDGYIGDYTSERMRIMADGKVGIGTSTPSALLDVGGNLTISDEGYVFHDYVGTSGNALYAKGNVDEALYKIENHNGANGIGLSVKIPNSSAGLTSVAISGLNNGDGIGVYGETSSGVGVGVRGVNISFTTQGDLGTDTGVFGIENTNNNHGFIGHHTYAMGGTHNSGNSAYIGDANYCVYADLVTKNFGDYAIYGLGADELGEGGDDYGVDNSYGGVKGYNIVGNPWTFGVAGYSQLQFERSGACLGSMDDGTFWGCLAYTESGGINQYAGYFTSIPGIGTGVGDDTEPLTNIGIGSWGDLIGANIHGKIYGTYSEGDRYAIFLNGKVFKNDLDIHLQKNENEQNIALYTNVSTDATVQTSGYAYLIDGNCSVSFDKAFTDAVSSSEPVIVTVTPLGNSNGVYLSNVTKNSFTIAENNGGKSDVIVSYIAIGKRAGYENPQLPQEVIASDYLEILSKGLHNDADTETDGEGLYFKDGQVYNGSYK